METVGLAKIKEELKDLFECLKQVQLEISAMLSPAEDEHKLDRTSEHLRAIVEATESSANAIMEATERNEMLVEQLRALSDNSEQNSLLDAISANSMSVFEACTFQDIAGQRISKAIEAIEYMDDRLKNLIEIWGKQIFQDVQVVGVAKTDDEKLLNGPQLPGEGVSQKDIDALFG